MEMNEGGDIWSTGIFSYESPLKDLLDSGNFELEDLLAEDELLQELRSNERLAAYFADRNVILKLLSYIVSNDINEPEEPPPLAQEPPIAAPVVIQLNGDEPVPSPKEPGAWLTEHIAHVKAGDSKKHDSTFRQIRFPYMACEVICSEVPKVLDLLVEPELLDVLWSLVTSTHLLDDYRAGYFDKITNVLFRRKPDEISDYINGRLPGAKHSKSQLLEALIRHLSSHSILQITQQLLMPPRPKPDETPEEEGDEIVAGDDDEVTDKQVRCEWTDQPQILASLLDTTLSMDSTAALNASEVITAVVQNSMLSSPIVLSLCSDETIQRLVDATIDASTFTRHESRNTIAMNVLENVILQLGGYGSIGTMTLMDSEEETTDQIADLTAILAHLHRLLDGFSDLLRHESTKEWKSPTQFSKDVPQPLLGTSRLRIIRVVESLILLGDPSVDAIMVKQSRCLECCLDFFWEYEWCSMLHQSVANLLVHAFEGQNIRSEIQEFLLVKCNLMERLMDSFPSSDEPAEKLRRGYMGHVIIICQALVHAYSPGEDEDDVQLNQYDENDPNVQDEGQISAVAELIPPDDVEKQEAMVEPIEAPSLNNTPDQSTDDGIPRDDFGEPLVLFEIVFNHRVAERWLEFVENVLAADNAMQVTPLGGYPVQAQSMMQRPGLVDEGFMMGDDGDGPPAPPARLSEVLQMDDSDLDVAVSMMDELNMREDESNGSGSSGDTTTEQRPRYIFDDPLGKADTLGVELNNLQQEFESKLSLTIGAENAPKEDGMDSDNDGSSSDEEPETQTPDVPVMDLFTGNFGYGEEQNSSFAIDDFADFANFDAVGRGGGPDTDEDFGPFATAEEKSKLDEIFGEGDHADLLENDVGETGGETGIVEDPFQSFDAATANRIFDENETIASLADEAAQTSPQTDDKSKVTKSLSVSVPIAEITPTLELQPGQVSESDLQSGGSPLIDGESPATDLTDETPEVAAVSLGSSEQKDSIEKEASNDDADLVHLEAENDDDADAKKSVQNVNTETPLSAPALKSPTASSTDTADQ